MRYHIKDQQSVADDLPFERPLHFSSPRQSPARSSVTAFSLAAFLCANPVLAGSYELIKGKGVEVCEAYAKNLNSFSPSEPMLCERPVNPKFNDFAKPTWEKLTDDQIAEINVDVIDRMLSMATPNSDVLKQPKSERIRKAKELTASAHNDSWPLSVVRGSADLDNDGKLESFVKNIYGKCNKPASPPSVVLHPIGEDATNAQLTKILRSAQYRKVDARNKCERYETERLTQKPFDARYNLMREACVVAMKDGGVFEETLGGFMYPDVFRYKGEWHLDVWATARESSDLRSGSLYVFKHRGGRTSELCQLCFNGDSL